MRFAVDPELELFAESVRGVVSTWRPPDVALAEWADDRDDALAARLAELGWAELWTDPELLAPAVAGGVELGRAAVPLHLLDEAALGAPLALDGRVRHGEGRSEAALAVAGGGLVLAPFRQVRREVSLDATGTLVVEIGSGRAVESASARWRPWSAATVAYLAGLADVSVARAVEHARSREQFGAPLAALPAVQARLADAALARDGLLLVAWSLADPDREPLPADELAWAGAACRQVTASTQQIHGAIGFALESGLHRAFRRAKTVQVWADAVCRLAAG